MLKTIAIIFGLILIAFGILGFMPTMAENGLLLGMFKVNLAHNVVYLATGIIAIWTGFSSNYAAKLFFAVFGIVYAIVAVLGFMHGDEDILGMIANNRANSWLHTVIAVVFLYLGFGVKAEK